MVRCVCVFAFPFNVEKDRQMQRADERDGVLARWRDQPWVTMIWAAIGAVALVTAAFLFSAPVRAEGAKSKIGTIRAAEPVAAPSWTGIYGGGFGQYGSGLVTDGDPYGYGSSGPMAGVAAGLTVQAGQLVFGAEISHAWHFGDLKDVGLDRDIEITGRGGVLLGSNVLFYGHVAWSQIHTKWGDFTGWKFGPGFEVRMPDAPGWSIDMRGGLAAYDIESVHSGADAEFFYGRVGLMKRFDVPKGWFGN